MTNSSAPAADTVPQVPLQIAGHYIRDISFENVSPTFTTKTASGNPTMDVNLNLDARPVDGIEDGFEVILKLQVTARRDQTTLFVAEIDYGTLAILKGVDEQYRSPLLFIEVPKLMFPFARAILADLTAQSGYPPLLLTPVDFYGMYIARFGGGEGGKPAGAQAAA